MHEYVLLMYKRGGQEAEQTNERLFVIATEWLEYV
jgi:hypothetical protein